MAIALSSIVSEVRDTTSDEDAAAYRVTDAKMVTYWNRFVRGVGQVRPDLFATIGDITCTTGETLQGIPAAGYQLIDIIRVKNGRAMSKCDRKALDRFRVNWHADTEGPAENWMPHEANPKQFYIYPKAPTAGQTLVGQWAQLPADLTAIADNIAAVLEPYKGAGHDFMVMCIESKDDEAVLAQRAEAFFKLFAAGMTASAQSREYLQGARKEHGDQVAQ